MHKSIRILIVGASWIGDMVMAQSLFITLKQQQPNCQIDVLAPKWTFALLERMPEVSQAIEMPLGHGKLGLIPRFNLGKQLRANHYDQAILLPNSWKSALTPFFAKIPIRTGYVGECRWGLLNDTRKLDKKILTQTVQRFVALAYPKTVTAPPKCPVPYFNITPLQQQQVLTKFNLNTKTKVLILCPGAEFGIAKRWLPEYFSAVANDYLKKNWQIWLMGSDKDQVVAQEINQQSDVQCRNFTGLTTIAEAVDLMSLATVIVANDSGLMHIGAGLNKKLIAIYGSSDPTFTPPLNKEANIMYLGLACSPCFKRKCPLEHTDCLAGIKPKQIIELIDKM